MIPLRITRQIHVLALAAFLSAAAPGWAAGPGPGGHGGGFRGGDFHGGYGGWGCRGWGYGGWGCGGWGWGGWGWGWPGYYGYGYYPGYVGPPAVYYAPGACVVPGPAAVQGSPAPPPQPSSPEETAPPPKPVQPQAAGAQPEALELQPVVATRTNHASQADVDRYLGLLADADEGVRLDAVTRLGRMRAARAMDPLAATLAGDRSPAVREAAARGLAILGDPRALPALLRASQNDAEQDVRRAAQFAVEVIQTR
jgi:HEAT repeats